MAARKPKAEAPEPRPEWPAVHLVRLVPFQELEAFLNAAAAAGFAVEWERWDDADDAGDEWKGGPRCLVYGQRLDEDAETPDDAPAD